MPFDYPEAGASASASGTTRQERSVSLKPYAVTVGGYQTTLLLNDEDARAQGLFKDQPEAKQASPKTNKARKAPNKSKG